MHPLLPGLRDFELEVALKQIPPHSTVLELGAGSGWQAKKLSELGHRVVAIDVERPPAAELHHPVMIYDGIRLPMADESIDVIFSSNVLEHVQDLPGLLAEALRVLKPGGVAVHVVPSPSWRAWTIITRYVWLFQVVSRRRQVPSQTRKAAAGAWRSSRRQLLRRVLLEPPHGEFSSSLAELTQYRAARWIQRFQRAGWTVTLRAPVGLFYTGYGVAPRLGVRARSRLSRRLGSSCTLFVLRRPGHVVE